MIGVFDSGSGGLSVLQSLRGALPNRDFTYLGDHANAPYGDRSVAEIEDLTRAGAERLFQHGCTIVIVACNTAAAAALRPLQRDWLPQAWPNNRILGVFVPMVEGVTGRSWDGRICRCRNNGARQPQSIGVFATTRTTFTSAWRKEIKARAPHIAVIQQQCPGLVAEIESGASERVLSDGVARFAAGLVRRLGTDPDAVILGCTHYALISHLFAAALAPTTRVLDQPSEIARSLVAYLDRHPEFRRKADERGRVRYLTTGDEARAGQMATRFLAAPVAFATVATKRVGRTCGTHVGGG